MAEENGRIPTDDAGCGTFDCGHTSLAVPKLVTYQQDITKSDKITELDSTLSRTTQSSQEIITTTNFEVSFMDILTSVNSKQSLLSVENVSDIATSCTNCTTTSTAYQDGTADLDKNWAIMGLLPLIVLVALGNVLVIMSVKMDHRLRSSTNVFLTSLAVADLLVALTVMPPSLAMIVNNYVWPFNESLCGIWAMLDVCFSTSSILHLCMISLDRYLALAKPFQYNGGWMPKSGSGGWGNDARGQSRWRVGSGLGGGPSKRTKRVAKRIFLVWAVALGISIPLPILASQDRNNVFVGDMCAINIRNFQIYASMAAFFLPLIVMFVTYSLTIRTLQKQSRLVARVMGQESSRQKRASSSTSSSVSSRKSFRKGSQRSMTGSSFRGPSGKKPRDNKLTSSTRLPDVVCSSENDICAEKIPLSTQSSVESAVCESYTPLNTSGESKIKRCAIICCSCVRWPEFKEQQQQSTIDNTDTVQKFDSDSSDTSSINQSARRSPMITRANMKFTKAMAKLPLKRMSTRRISASMKSRAIATEQRASKVLGMIFTLFCIFWCPFFITNVMSRLCTTCDPETIGNLLNWFVWVGYVSSGVNPCVYTLFSKRFRDTFGKLLTCRFNEIGRRPLARAYSDRRRGGGNSTTNLRANFQFSVESKDLMSSEAFGNVTELTRSVHRANNTTSRRTFRESVIFRQHRRSQYARSVDVDMLPEHQASTVSFQVEDDMLPAPELASKIHEMKIQWRTTWPDGKATDNESHLEVTEEEPKHKINNIQTIYPVPNSEANHRTGFNAESNLTKNSQWDTTVPDGHDKAESKSSDTESHTTSFITTQRFRSSDDTASYISEDSEYDNNNSENVFLDNEANKILTEPARKKGPVVRFYFEPLFKKRGRAFSDGTYQHCDPYTARTDENYKFLLQVPDSVTDMPVKNKVQYKSRPRNLSYSPGVREFSFGAVAEQISRLDSGIGGSTRNSQHF